MADFVAVIRRTVDGLSDNVPEMRAKVYEKARGAVRRQLESMKPRPSDEMIERQMVKLEAAINEVEDDHAEALPLLDEQQPDSTPEAVDAEEHAVEPAERETAEDEAPAVEAAEDSHEDRDTVVEEVSHAPVEPVEQYDEHAATVAPVEVSEPPIVEEYADRQPEPETVAEADSATSFGDEYPQAEPVPPAEPEGHQPEAIPESVASDEPEHQAPVAFEQPDDGEAGSRDAGHAAETVEAEQVAEHHDEPAEHKSAPPASSEWELPEWSDPVPAAAHNETVWTEAADTAVVDEIPDLSNYEPVETVTPLRADAGGKDQAAAEPSHSWAWDDSDPFTQSPAPAAADTSEPAISDWSWPVEKPAVVEPEEQKKASSDSWNEIDELLEHGSTAVVGAAAASQAGRGHTTSALDEEMEVPARPVSYRVEPKRSRFNVKAIGLAAGLLAVLGGAGYAYWQNQTAVNAWVSSMLASVTAEIPGQTKPDVSVPEDASKDLTTPETNNQTQTPANTEVASVEGNTKFTQRLQQDGTEIDAGPAAAPAGENPTEEGKSVAAQTEAGKPVDTAQATPTTPAGQTTGEAQPAQPVPGQQTATDPATQQVPAGAQKMFLYEERLGQSAPTAIEGNVAWSVKEESPGGDAKPEPVVQAQINVPERGLTALMTIKRNADSSLPASHVVEFVFSLPENFEGGSIDSVQRVAMKRNEQDRGDPLIAVPAKITDDFHMIALNDFPEAVATNTELLRTRSWIDIPLTYRNGRRALLTLEKGTAGTEAFTKAMQAWSLVAKPNPTGQ